jgi:hypothetical protein
MIRSYCGFRDVAILSMSHTMILRSCTSTIVYYVEVANPTSMVSVICVRLGRTNTLARNSHMCIVLYVHCIVISIVTCILGFTVYCTVWCIVYVVLSSVYNIVCCILYIVVYIEVVCVLVFMVWLLCCMATMICVCWMCCLVAL